MRYFLSRVRTLQRPASAPVWLIGIGGLAIALRFISIGSHSLWFDEAISGLAIRYDLNTLATHQLDPPASPVYFLLLGVWMRGLQALGSPATEAALRSLSAVCSVGALLPVYLIGRDLFDRRIGLWAAFLLAISPFQVGYAQEARSYSLMIWCSAWITWLFWRAIQQDRKADWIALTLLSVFGLYVHYMLGLLLLALQAYAVCLPARRRLAPRLFSIDAAILICILPMLPGILGQSAQLVDRPSWLAPLVTLPFLFFGYVTTLGAAFVAAALFCILALTLVLLVQVRPAVNKVLLLESVIFLPMLLLLSVSFFVRPFYFDRYFAFATPAFSVFLAQGITLRAKGLVKLLLGLLVLLAGLRLADHFVAFDPAKPPFREASRFIVLQARPDDIVFHVHDSTFASFRYYAPDVPAALWLDDDATWLFPTAWPWYGLRITDLSILFQGHPRIWIMSLPDTLDQARRNLEAQIAGRYPRVLVERFENVEVSLYAAPARAVNDGP